MNTFYRTALRYVSFLLLTGSISLPAQTLTTLHSFNGSDGSNPYAQLLQASDGNFYGTTAAGGAHNDGTVFQLTPSGTLTTIHSCNQFILSDCNQPYGWLIQARDGNLYGTTAHGGLARQGTIYRLALDGTFRVIDSFIYALDGSNTQAGLFQASNGTMYGTAPNGGNNGSGTVYEVTPFGQLSGIYYFGAEGSSPVGGLVQAGNGNLYGTAGVGGQYSCGIAFEVTPGGSFTPLVQFGNRQTEGCFPYAGLTLGTDGSLYGTTSQGGAPQGFNAGIAFKMTPTGTFTILHVFDVTDGSAPLGALLLASDGNFYGTTEVGGAHNFGTIFKMTPAGTVTSLYSFCSQSGCSDGKYPYAGLIEGSDGNLYGTTTAGGSADKGTVFRLATGLPR